MNWELQLTRPVRTHRSDLPEIIRTLGDAVDMIDEHLPETLRIRPVWQQVKDMLVTAAETRTAQDVETATALLERALEEEGLNEACGRASFDYLRLCETRSPRRHSHWSPLCAHRRLRTAQESYSP
jgi:hypothetical protein